jgi:transposase
MRRKAAKNCAGCRRLQQQVAAQRTQLEQLQQTVRDLQQQLAAARKDSSTSSKPPSSDIVKPSPAPASEDQARRPAGGQYGHPKHERPLLPAERLTAPPVSYSVDICPDCGHGLHETSTPPRVVQQLDIHDVPLTVEEHRALAGWCPHCQRTHYAPLPSGIERGGLVGPRLTTLIAYLKGVCHASYSTIRKYLRDVLQVTLSRGMLQKVIQKVSEALEEPYEELLKALPGQWRLNVDETRHRDRGELWWTWCFRAELYTLFKIEPSRSGDVLIEVLGREFAGVLGCDYFSAYRRYMRECGVVVQFCLAHLIRDVKFLTTLPDREEQSYGERLREALRALFAVIHGREVLTEKEFGRQLEEARQKVLAAALTDVPAGRHSQNLKKRFERHGAAYFQFITTPGVEPTNNLAEQAIRFVVIDRRITQGTRGEGGRNWCERIWTVIASCAEQGRSVFAYLHEAVQAYFQKAAAPSLLPLES